MDSVNVKIANSEEERVALFELRTKVYSKWGYLESKTQKDIDEYDLDSKSIHFIAKFNRTIVGTIRLIFADKTTLPIEREFNLRNIISDLKAVDRKEIVEISRLVSDNHITKKFNDNRIMIALIKAIHDFAYKTNKLFWLAAIDNEIYNRFQKMGITWNKIGDERFYLGSYSTPAELYLPDAMMKLQKNNPQLWGLISNESEIIKVE